MIKSFFKVIRNFFPKQSNYVGLMDQFLFEFDKKNRKLSSSQSKEIEKYKKIYQLRDNPNAEGATVNKKLWKDF